MTAIGWVAVELLRLLIPVLGTWGFLGYAMYRQTWFIQPVAAVGMFGLDLLIVVTNYAIALLVIQMLARQRRHRSLSHATGPLAETRLTG